ncbi:hypothetical protein BZA77DRAFT_383903 [Pyronema omphalodes]|nr:hypothetical protein BZA77DRAFT_383903 [Pyronema omphalodes]
MTTLTTIPPELLKLIAGFLPTINDIINLSRSSIHCHNAINSDQIVWRSAFLNLYDPPRYPLGYDYKASLARRRKPNAETMLDMIYDANPNYTHPRSSPISPNLRQLRLPYDNPTLSLLLYPHRFSPEHRLPPLTHFAVNDAACRVYSRNSNAFSHFFPGPPTSKTDQTLHDISLLIGNNLDTRIRGVFTQTNWLEPREFPSFWCGRLGEISKRKTPRKWLGAYTYLTGGPYHQIDPQQDIDECGDNSLALIRLSNLDRFEGEGVDFMPFRLTNGSVVDLPDGRCWVKFWKDYGEFRWFYSGVMMPGKNLVLGMWCLPGDEWSNFGIFMLWAVPDDTKLDVRM